MAWSASSTLPVSLDHSLHVLAHLLTGYKVHPWEELQMEVQLHVLHGWSAHAEPLRHWLCFAADSSVCRAPPVHCMQQAPVCDICQSYSFEQVMRHVDTKEKNPFSTS